MISIDVVTLILLSSSLLVGALAYVSASRPSNRKRH